MVIVPVMSYLWQVQDALIGFLGGVSLLFCYVLRGTAYVDWILYLGNYQNPKSKIESKIK